MSSHPSVEEAARILAQFPSACGQTRIMPQSNRGGFSGAKLWRVESSAGPLCLRAWPAGGMTSERLADIHRLMAKAREAGLAFVPVVLPTGTGATWLEWRDRLWELTALMRGQADDHAKPSVGRVRAAFVALARLHLAWASTASISGPCPGVQRRLEAARDWHTLLQSGWHPAFSVGRASRPSHGADPVQPWAERAWPPLQNAANRIIDQLEPWASRPFFLHPCLCDVWHDHVLFDGDTVTGIVDYGGVKLDHVGVDLARLLGSMVGDDPELRSAALTAYSRLRPVSLKEEALITTLDQTGTLVGAMTWLKWLYLEGKHFEDREAAARKLAELVERMERWN